MKTLYSRAFYDRQKCGSLKSAEYLVPFLLDLCQPTSVIDVGCGVGSWAFTCMQNGIEDVVGIDGPWMIDVDLLIPPEKFVSSDFTDLQHPFRRFDLAISLEVAEHLPEKYADRFIFFLVSVSDVIAFSAAIPNQGGTNHVNEQWPNYWAEKFLVHNYECFDVVRPAFWINENVEWWYIQNTFVYVKKGALTQFRERMADMPSFSPLSALPTPMVHPRMYIR